MQNHYFDITHQLHPYTHSAYAAPDTIAPVNALRQALPEAKKGYHWGENEGDWIYIEDHREEKGYVNGVAYTIEDYGPYPEGWSETPPPLTTEELFDRLRGQRNARINSVLWMRERHADELELGKETTLTPEQYTALLTYIQALRDLPDQLGAPWPGGDIPWPAKPEV